ncbi:MAG TPA: DNA alkylation repair protein [Candidatus Kapabacteria bacterium]|nr:DNA alkylation repair protein [Candidatus Kapabacteria bacterium]
MKEILLKVREELEKKFDEKTKAGSQHFFKEKVKVIGVKSSDVQRISKEVFKFFKLNEKAHIFDLCEKLWQSGYLEESFIACNWSYNVHNEFLPADFDIFEKWIKKYIDNWASCDTFCNHTIGEFIEMYPEYISKLKENAKSDNRWVRRAAAVSLIVPAKKGKFLNDVFEIADILLLDKDDLVQKGYGWLLKVASQLNQKAVFEYVVKNKAVMPRTALRYAIEKMPPDLKSIAMAK